MVGACVVGACVMWDMCHAGIHDGVHTWQGHVWQAGCILLEFFLV